MEQMVSEYREGVQTAVHNKRTDWPEAIQESDLKVEEEGVLQSSSDGVRFVLVPNAPHHLQNDVQRDVGGEALSRFVEQL